MREIYEKTYRRNNFTFNINNHDYTQSVICVNFSYSHKLFNKHGKNIFIREGYSYSDLVFKDCSCVIDGQLVGIEVGKSVSFPISNDILGKYFSFYEGKYIQNGVIPNVLTKSELRQNLYENGFYCDGIKYIRFKRSSGSSRLGKCLFIDEKLYKAFHKWDLCGLKIKEGDQIDLAAFEAYISLTSSSIIDTIQIEPKNFLVIEDKISTFKDNVVGIKYSNGDLTAEESVAEISNSIFDGQTLMDCSLFEDNYKDKGMLLLRNRFFKSACFNTNIQQWFKDNNITDIKQLNGFTLADDIKDIKLITTKSSIKYCKFASLEQWFKNIDSTFGIVKHEKPTHFFDGRMVQSHYQLLNTLQLTQKEISELLKPNLDYIRKIRNDPDVLRYHIKYPYNTIEKITPLHSKNEIVFKLIGMNKDFCKTKLYDDFKNDLVKSMIKNLKQGHLLIHGNYSTMLGNGIEMLQEAIGTFHGTSTMGIGNIFCKNFEFNKTILGSRSPHINQGNVFLSNNKYNPLFDKYFNLSNEIVCVNSIGENIQQRLNGCDFDSDQILLTDNPILINAAKKNYNLFKVPTCLVDSVKVKRHYTNYDKSDLDVKTSVNKIGEIINLSQYLNSILWNNINNKQTFEENKELYYDICKLAVLSGIEIDRAKKEYELSSIKIIKQLKDKWGIINSDKLTKPTFLKMVTINNGYQPNKNHTFKHFKTPMDFVQREINKFNFRENRAKSKHYISFNDIIVKPTSTISGRCYESMNRILSLIMDLKSKIDQQYMDYEKKTKDEKNIISKEVAKLRQDCIEYINDISLNEKTMYLLLKTIENTKYKKIQKLIFSTLFGTPNKMFFTMIKNASNIQELEENPYGSINIFGYNFIKINAKTI